MGIHCGRTLYIKRSRENLYGSRRWMEGTSIRLAGIKTMRLKVEQADNHSY